MRSMSIPSRNHQTESRVISKARIRHPRGPERLVGFVPGFRRPTLFMQDERERPVPLIELDRKSQPIPVPHQKLDGSVVTRAHALGRDQNRQLVKGPRQEIRNGVLTGKRRLEREDRRIHVAKRNMGARTIEVRLGFL